MSWITVDTKLGNHPKMAALPSDAARYGWILTLLEAKEQRTPGTFASEKHYRHVMPRHGRFLPDYIKAGLMDKGDDETLHVHDWRRHQWAGAKGQQRETSLGHAEDIAETSEGQKEDASRAVPVYVPVSSSSTEGVQGEPTEIFAIIARAGAFMRPDSGLGLRLMQLIDRRGFDVVMAEVVRVVATGARLSDRQWVFGLERALESIPEPELAADARAVERQKLRDRQQEDAAERRLHYFAETGKWDPAFGPEPRWKPEWGERPAA